MISAVQVQVAEPSLTDAASGQTAPPHLHDNAMSADTAMEFALDDTALHRWVREQCAYIVRKLTLQGDIQFSNKICVLIITKGWWMNGAIGFYSPANGANDPRIVINAEALQLSADYEPDGAIPFGNTFYEGQARFVFDLLVHELLHDADRHTNGEHNHGPSFQRLCEAAGPILGIRVRDLDRSSPRWGICAPRNWPHSQSYYGTFQPVQRTPRHRQAVPLAAPGRSSQPFVPCTAAAAVAIMPMMFSILMTLPGTL